MLTILQADFRCIHYRVAGKVGSADIDLLFQTINPLYQRHGEVNLLSEVPRFRGYASLWAMIKVLRNEPTLLWKAHKYALVTDDQRLQRLFSLAARLLPRPAVKVFSLQQLNAAKNWLTSN
ncbi:STAS/SEC14 domain-containing protein [Lewinella sp. W8]|uniref:STAS/SEC14 domain-containing protein n=1 Tax=Lewinella sp. W8 TaxID=2528208 RepID=UPI001565967D|nr:STAS/SEC14 domain-containing protein [Lewinella sp. W8]